MLRSMRRVVSSVRAGWDIVSPTSPVGAEIVRLDPVKGRMPEKRSTMTAPQSLTAGRLIDIIGTPTSSGAPVNERTALGMSAVTACVSIMANMVAKLPIYLYQSTPQGPREITKHPALYLIGREPSELHTSFELRHLMETGKGLGGNGYARVFRDGSWTPRSIQWIKPCDVTPRLVTKGNGEKFVAYDVKGEKSVLTRSELLHVKMLSIDGIKGVSPVHMARESIGTSLSQTTAAGSLMRNGAKFGGFLTSDVILDKEKIADARDEFNRNYSGAMNAGKIPVLNGIFKFQAVNGMSMVDAQFIESRKFEIHEVARIYGIPLFMVDSTASTAWGSGIESLNLTFLNNCLDPHLVGWEQSLDYTLLTQEEKQSGFYFRFDRDEIANVALEARANFYQAMRNIGVFSPNDVRAKLGEPLLTKEQGGDTYGGPLASNAKIQKEEPKDEPEPIETE